MFRPVVLAACATIGVLAIALAAALAFGGPSRPKPMLSISAPFKDVDFSALPPPRRYAARDGARLAYRFYAPAGSKIPLGSVVLVHGSSANI
jgi:non-heme chloroperoxidase